MFENLIINFVNQNIAVGIVVDYRVCGFFQFKPNKNKINSYLVVTITVPSTQQIFKFYFY